MNKIVEEVTARLRERSVMGMSGASGKVPAAIHVYPKALDGGALAYLCDGDVVTVDAEQGVLQVHVEAAVYWRVHVHRANTATTRWAAHCLAASAAW